MMERLRGVCSRVSYTSKPANAADGLSQIHTLEIAFPFGWRGKRESRRKPNTSEGPPFLKTCFRALALPTVAVVEPKH